MLSKFSKSKSSNNCIILYMQGIWAPRIICLLGWATFTPRPNSHDIASSLWHGTENSCHMFCVQIAVHDLILAFYIVHTLTIGNFHMDVIFQLAKRSLYIIFPLCPFDLLDVSYGDGLLGFQPRIDMCHHFYLQGAHKMWGCAKMFHVIHLLQVRLDWINIISIVCEHTS